LEWEQAGTTARGFIICPSCDGRGRAFNGLREFPVRTGGPFELTPLPSAEPGVEWGFKLRFSSPGTYKELDCTPLSYAEVCQHNVCKVTREDKPYWFGHLDIEGHGEGYWLLPRTEEDE